MLDVGITLSYPMPLDPCKVILENWYEVMVAYLKVGPQVRTYSDYLRAAREAEKEDSIELS